MILWGPVVAYMAVIFYVSSQTDIAPIATNLVSDKILHALEYAVLAVLVGHPAQTCTRLSTASATRWIASSTGTPLSWRPSR